MRLFREHLRWAVIAVLACQFLAFAGLPAALCCAAEPHAAPTGVSVQKEKPCCPDMTPGQVCPMHRAASKKAEGGSRIGCAGDDVSIALLGFVGVLMPPPATDADVAPAGRILGGSFAPIAFDTTPPAPPPRL